MIRRTLISLVAMVVVVAIAVWLADHPGTVSVRWLGFRIYAPVPLFLAAMAVVMAVLFFAGRSLVWVWTLPGRMLASHRARRTKDGYRALSDGLAAVAVGDSRNARKLARRADRLLSDHSLTSLLTAQAAELAGDPAEAEIRLSDMTARPETAFFGLKGLMALALRKGDSSAALDYARRAWDLRPGAEGLAPLLFDLQATAGAWAEAETTLVEARKKGSLSGADLQHRQAVVWLEQSRPAEAAGEVRKALKLCIKAHRADPMLIPAAVRAAELLHRQGRWRRAASVLETTWRINPHPALIEAVLALAPMETVLDKVKRLDRLVKANPDAIDGHIALAEAELGAKLWGPARSHLEFAVGRRPTGGVFVSLARLEREERNDETAAQTWLAKSTMAPQEPNWSCRKCGQPSDAWTVLCPHCHGVDTLEWGQPGLAAPLKA